MATRKVEGRVVADRGVLAVRDAEFGDGRKLKEGTLVALVREMMRAVSADQDAAHITITVSGNKPSHH